MKDANFERIFLAKDNHLAWLAELLAIGENVNVYQRHQNEG